MRFLKQNIILSLLNSTFISYICPINLNYFWNLGVVAAAFMAIQIVTGIFLAMHYVANAELAFSSVEHIMRDVNYGWLLRYLHSNGAAMFFLAVYIHIFRGIFYGSFLHPRQFLWATGIFILLIMILTAFLGYVLPWGQMSFWAATVITNLASAIPIVGDTVVLWLWGGFAVDNATLNRFFSLHYLFPFIIAALVILHIAFLHQNGSSNPMGLSMINIDGIYFHPYYTIKDALGLCFFFFAYLFFVFFAPNALGHSDNYIPANPLVTPNHIVPEWYFLPFYAMLRSIPNKLLGVIVLVLSIVVFLLLPFIYFFSDIVLSRKFIFFQSYKQLVWVFFFSCLILGWIGGNLVETPFYQIGQIFTFIYFLFFVFFANLQFFYFSKRDLTIKQTNLNLDLLSLYKYTNYHNYQEKKHFSSKNNIDKDEQNEIKLDLKEEVKEEIKTETKIKENSNENNFSIKENNMNKTNRPQKGTLESFENHSDYRIREAVKMLKEEIKNRKPYYLPYVYKNLTEDLLIMKYEMEEKKKLEKETMKEKPITLGEIFDKKNEGIIKEVLKDYQEFLDNPNVPIAMKVFTVGSLQVKKFFIENKLVDDEDLFFMKSINIINFIDVAIVKAFLNDELKFPKNQLEILKAEAKMLQDQQNIVNEYPEMIYDAEVIDSLENEIENKPHSPEGLKKLLSRMKRKYKKRVEEKKIITSTIVSKSKKKSKKKKY